MCVYHAEPRSLTLAFVRLTLCVCEISWCVAECTCDSVIHSVIQSNKRSRHERNTTLMGNVKTVLAFIFIRTSYPDGPCPPRGVPGIP